MSCGARQFWQGETVWDNTEDRFDTSEKLAALLDELAVTIVVIDDRVPPEQQRPYHDRLRKLVASESERWELLGSYPQIQSGIVFTYSLHSYARRPVGAFSPDFSYRVGFRAAATRRTAEHMQRMVVVG